MLPHILPKRFRCVRDFGNFRGNCKRLVQMVHLRLGVLLSDQAVLNLKSPA
jgi:hypothetical protein